MKKKRMMENVRTRELKREATTSPWMILWKVLSFAERMKNQTNI